MRSLFVVCIAAALLSGCKDNSVGVHSPSSYFAVDLQSDFERDLVRVQIDGKVIFNDTANTNLVLSLARHLTPTVEQGTHLISVAMADTKLVREAYVDVGDTTTLAVTYNRQTQQFAIAVYHSIILYD